MRLRGCLARAQFSPDWWGRFIFVGADGVRAGWRIGLFLAFLLIGAVGMFLLFSSRSIISCPV